MGLMAVTPLLVSSAASSFAADTAWTMHSTVLAPDLGPNGLHRVGLQGSSASGIPVGAEAYSMTTHPQQVPSTPGRADSASRTEGQASCNGSTTGTACSEPGALMDSPSPSAAPEPPAEPGGHEHEPARLEGVGALLPAWREVAGLIAPMCHQVMAVPR